MKYLGALALVAFLAQAAWAVKPVDFEDILSGSKLVANGASVRALAWPFTGSCADADAGFDRAQCNELKRRAKDQFSQTTYRVEVPAVVRQKGKSLLVYGCLDCGGDDPLTVGPGAVVREKGVVLGPKLGAFKKKVDPKIVPHLVSEIVFRLDGRGRPKLYGFRTYDACSGEVVASRPPSEDRNPSKKCE